MVEYLLLSLAVVMGAGLFHWLGLNTAWIVVPILLGSLPSVYVMLFGAPFIPTNKRSVAKMMELAQIRPGEKVCDLGCGDGRLVKEASKAGADAVGYEMSVYLFCYAWLNNPGHIRYQNFWKADLRDADVVFMYQLPKAMERFEREIWPMLKPGCRVVVNTFPFPNLELSVSIGHIYRYEK